MDAPASSYEASAYTAPNVVRITGNALRVLRGRYSSNFTDVFSPNREVQHEYTNGLVAVMFAFVIILLFWVFVLFTLKFLGSEVGCAAGLPFFSSQAVDDEISTDDDEASLVSSLELGSQADSQENSVTKLIKKKARSNSFSSNDNGDVTAPATTEGKKKSVNRKDQVVQRRERRTRRCFMLASILAFTCVPVILVLSFGPMREAANNSKDIAELTRDIILQVNYSVSSIEDAIVSAREIVHASNLTIEAVCPNIDNLELDIGRDLMQLIYTATVDLDSVMKKSDEKTDYVRRLIYRGQRGVDQFEASVKEGEDWMWIVPSVLFTVCIVTFMSMFGVILVWKGNSGRKVQQTMSYVILPLLVVTTLFCWMIVLATSLGTMVGSDACTASSAKGSPDNTIQQVLGVLKLDPNSTISQLTQTYTNQCMGAVPSEAFDDLEVIVQNHIDELWQLVSRVDSIGRSEVIETCGGTELEGLLLDARTLAKLLTTIRRSLDSASISISCPRINPLYISLVHDTICTEATAAGARGFIFFLVLGVSLMTMVSLRAAWLQVIPEEKVYHEEMDMAENMILDEHEEYLAYISKYKHEWEEYRGFDEKELESPYNEDDEEGWSSAPGSSSAPDDDAEDDGEYYGSSPDAATSGFQVIIIPTGDSAVCSMDEYMSPNHSVAKTSASNEQVIQDDLFKDARPPPQNPDYKIHRAAVRSKSTASQPSRPGRSFFDKFGITTDQKSPVGVPPPPPENPELGVHRAAVRSKSDATQPSRPGRSFFDKFAIEPGHGAPDKGVDPSALPSRLDPPDRSGSFFARYGIEPGQSARAKSVGPSSPRPSFDPPARGPSLGRLPSGRPFFKATFTELGDTEHGEIEIELKTSTNS